MGLCKCPKKKVTTLFCFEHTVNVCEHCLVESHPKCIVQSYLRWLQDSDYDPTCRLCGKNLTDDSCGDCVRLMCYDVFHWSCLDSYQNSLPPNTAPAGYVCPICSSSVFPPPNSSSPVVDALLSKLSTASWARTGLGLPMIEEKKSQLTTKPLPTPSSDPPLHIPKSSTLPPSSTSSHPQSSFNDKSQIFSRTFERSDFLSSAPLLSLNDHDLDKYRRRPPLQTMARWISNIFGSENKNKKSTLSPSNTRMKRNFLLILLFFLAFITIIFLFNKIGRHSVENDPLLDPLNNPNIHVQP